MTTYTLYYRYTEQSPYVSPLTFNGGRFTDKATAFLWADFTACHGYIKAWVVDNSTGETIKEVEG